TFNELLNSRDIVRYKIRIQNEDNLWSDYSEEHSFEMGLLSDALWIAKWISGNYNANKKTRYPVDYFKKEFIAKKINKARLYISACGVYEAFINEARVGNFVLAPGSTDPRKRIQYQSYDVTHLIKEGNNEIKVLLADGWYRGSIGAKGFTCVFGKTTKIIAQLELSYEDKEEVVITDKTWSWSNDGAIRFSDLKDGEIVDLRMAPSFSGKAKEVNFKANLKESNNEYVIENEVNSPKNIFKNDNGNYILEFDNNVAGYLAFTLNGKSGETIDIVLGEMLDETKEVTLKNVQCVRGGKKTPLQEIHIVLKDGINDYHPKFFVSGFKYASVKTNVGINKDDFKQIAIYTKLTDTSTFDSSNELINIFYDNTIRSLKSNSIDIPTDCPTRERMGWTGDSQVFFETASFLESYEAFTRKHIVDVYDRQDKNGRLPQIAPYSAEDWFMNVMNGSVGWADVGILTPYRFYKKYGDKRLLVNNFTNMERYAKFMISRCGRAKGIYSIYAKRLHLSKENKKYQVNTGQSYGEWAEPNDVKAFVWTDFCMPHPEESMAYTAWMMRLMQEICDIVGRSENKELYKEYEEGITKAYQELVTKDDYSLDTNRQAKLVRPLYLNLLTDGQKKFAKERLIKALDFYSWRLGTGFLSTPFILNVLSSINPEYAYKLLENEEMPGWLYMAKNNTGTIWEGWEGPAAQAGIASLNHYSKGAMVEWLFNGCLGINVKCENEFLLKPIIGGKVTNASGSYDSIYGKISLSWKRENDKVIFDISIPSNTKALFSYNGVEKELNYGTYHFEL
ncbi:MAG: family 78 glycoside hydrolase catalytic domain, partial [Bacilli bacterium]|nr:family 78 glycoside hydrolase catalytic domain [Bacilli bacterium]